MNDFVEVKTPDLIGDALDWAVAKAQDWRLSHVEEWQNAQDGWGRDIPGAKEVLVKSAWKFWHDSDGALVHLPRNHRVRSIDYKPSIDWGQCGLLIDSNVVIISKQEEGKWWSHSGNNLGEGHTALIAVCRAIVASKLGDKVDIPAELVK